MSGHRAVLRHEATLEAEQDRPRRSDEEDRRRARARDGRFDAHRQWISPGRHAPSPPRGCAVTGEEYHIVPTVEANGNKPITPLSVTAEPRCVSVKELQLGRRS